MIATLIKGLVDFYILLIIVFVLMSWFPHDKGFLHDLYSVLESICDPFLALFRKIIPPLGNVDFSPIVAVLVLDILERLIVSLL